MGRFKKKVDEREDYINREFPDSGLTKSDAYRHPALSEKQLRFCAYYVELHNAEDAYRLAYNSKSKFAGTQGLALLSNPFVVAEIKKLEGVQRSLVKRTVIEKADAVNLLTSMVHANVTDFLAQDEDGTITVKSFSDIPKESLGAIESIEQTDKGYVRLKLTSKLNALKQIGSWLGWEEAQKIEINANVIVGDKRDVGKIDIPIDEAEIID
jgi:phage terminase small subunit